jgi:HlyD family secretion protein
MSASGTDNSARSHSLGLRTSVRWARAITWTLVIGSAAGITWLALAKTDEIVVAPGKLEPTGQVRDVQIPVAGVVSEVLVREGQTVKKGDVLLRLDPERNAFELGTLQQQLTLNRREQGLKQQQLERYLKQNSAQLSQLERSLVLQRELLRRLEQLEEQGASAEFQTLQQRNRVEELQGEIEQVQQERARRTAELNQERQTLLSQQAELASRRQQTDQLLRYQEVRAPVAGVVFELKPKGPGFVANASEPLLSLVPFDQVKAQVEIPSRDIGFVKVGQPVDVNIDSFPANDFGVLEGTVTQVGSDALPPDPAEGQSEYRFPASITLASQQLQLQGEQALPLQVGMSLQAHIKLRKVSYLQLLLGRFRSRADSLRRV